MSEESPAPHRRAFMTGDLSAGKHPIDVSAEFNSESERNAASSGTLRVLSTVAMACDVEILLNAGSAAQLEAASGILDSVHELEQQLSAYRPDSELSRLNAAAADDWVVVEPQLFDLLRESQRLSAETAGAFDPTTGKLIALWRRCRQEGRLPTENELAEACGSVGIGAIEFDDSRSAVRFGKPGLELNLGGIGKGYVLDRCRTRFATAGVGNYVMHAGFSSVVAAGNQSGSAGWPVGIRHPLIPGSRLATLILRDSSLSTSGSGQQNFRVNGVRYGHIFDPRSGWPVEGMLSVTVMAASAAMAEAASTAFFVQGVEKSVAYCHNQQGVAAILVPVPQSGRRLTPVICGFDPGDLCWQAGANVDPVWENRS